MWFVFVRRFNRINLDKRPRESSDYRSCASNILINDNLSFETSLKVIAFSQGDIGCGIKPMTLSNGFIPYPAGKIRWFGKVMWNRKDFVLTTTWKGRHLFSTCGDQLLVLLCLIMSPFGPLNRGFKQR